jgi:alkylhydroperoxidase family enzyme
MTRIALKSEDQLDAEARTRIRGLIGPAVPIPNLWLLIGNAPELLKPWTEFSWPLRKVRYAPTVICELMILRTAQLSHAEYTWAHHWGLVIAAGGTERQLASLSSWRQSDLFSTPEKAALGLADELVVTGRVSDAVFKAARESFEPAALTQLIMLISFYVCVTRFTAALELDLEPHYLGVPSMRASTPGAHLPNTE